MQKEAFLVVISVLEGRNFPSRPKHQLIIECKFDGELLATDPVSHSESPNFTTELAWEMDRRALHQHKMQRTPVKLLCFAVDTSTMIRESVGYVLLDLRGAHPKSKDPKWYNLLSSKYSRLKPGIKLSMMLENDNAEGGQVGFKATEAPSRLIPSSGSPIKPVLNEKEAYFQIGSDKSCEMFVLAVTLGSAFHLEQLIYGHKPLPSVHSGFFFYYSLFGNDITNDSFHNLLSPNITPERASIRIRSTVHAIKAYLMELTKLQVYLCCSDQVLGTANVSFSPLFGKKQLSLIDSEPILIEGIYPLFPPTKTAEKKSMQPSITVSICLRKESVPPPPDVTSPINPIKHSSPEAAPHELPVKDTNHKPIPFPDLSEDLKLESKPKAEEKAPSSEENDVATVNTEDDAVSLQSNSGTASSELPKPDLQSVKCEDNHPSLATTETHTDVPAPLQHFRFTLDTTTINTLKLPFPVNLFLKYSYPFFGSFSPIFTGAVEAKNHSEFRIPRSKCVFDFACPPKLINNTFRKFPIVLEVWHQDNEANDEMLGIATLNLQQILEADRLQFTCGENKCEKFGYRQTCHGTVPVLSTKKEKIAEISVVAVLEDFGIVVDQTIIRPTKIVRASPSPRQKSAKVPSQKVQVEEPYPTDVRHTAEYKSALEVELWKAQEKESFSRKLKELELQHLKMLGEEFAKRDKERELLVAKQVSEYQSLERQLASTINGLENREQQVASAELELNRLREDAVREKERIILEAKEASKRMKEDCIHQVQLEREKRSVIEEQNKKLLKEVNSIELKYSTLMSQFYEFKKEQSSRPEVQLQAELNLVKLEKAEVERKLESSIKSKLHYKQQWGRTLKELAMIKKREQECALANLKQQQQELETLKLHYLASDEKAAISSDKDKLKKLEDDIKSFKKRKEDTQLSSIAIESCFPKVCSTEPVNERISRLIEERDTLLRTGVYSKTDRIICELDRQIQDEMERERK